MLVTKQPVLRRFWYPVMPSSRLDGEPVPFTLLGTDIVLWRSETGGPACLKDRCCHRTAKLSLGFIEGDRLVCGYHGWSYRADGICVRIPQRENPENVAGVQVPAYRVAERYGYIWVALDEPLTDIPDVPEASRSGFRQVDQFYELWNIAAFRLMENSPAATASSAPESRGVTPKVTLMFCSRSNGSGMAKEISWEAPPVG